MHLITNINATASVSAGETKLGKIKATLRNPIGIEPAGGYSADVDYTVIVDEAGEDVEYKVIKSNNGRELIPESVFQALYDLAKASLPSDADMHLRLMTMGYKVVEAKMIEQYSELTSSANFDLVP